MVSGEAREVEVVVKVRARASKGEANFILRLLSVIESFSRQAVMLIWLLLDSRERPTSFCSTWTSNFLLQSVLLESRTTDFHGGLS